MLSLPGSTLIVTAANDAARAETLRATGAEVLQLGNGGKVDLNALLVALASREVNEVLVEAGSTLSGALLEAGLVDELVLYYAPVLLGDQGRGMLDLGALGRLEDAPRLAVHDVSRFGPDLRIVARLRD